VENGNKIPLYLFGITSWLDGMTSGGRAWLSGKFKILDHHRILWIRGKGSPFAFILAASGEVIIVEDWFARLRHEYFIAFLSMDGGDTPRVFFFPKEKPQVAFILRPESLSGDGAYFRKELGLAGGSSIFNKNCLFCDVSFGQ
jgi:hypothetical protein